MAKLDNLGESEIVICSSCDTEKTLYYSLSGEVVSESACKCNKINKRINGLTPLDYALKRLSEVLNGKDSKPARKTR